MKKYLLMMMAVFAYTSVNAAKIAGGVLNVNPGDDFDRLDDITDCDDRDYSKIHTLKFEGNFSSGWDAHWWNSDASEPTQITTIDMSGADFCNNGQNMSTAEGQYATWSLKGFNNLTTVIWPGPGKIVVIPAYAFNQSGRPADQGGWQVEIPGYIKLIKQNAFNETSDYKSLKSVVFKEYPETGASQVDMVIETQAFQNCYNLFDVYIETLGTLNAAYNAFPFWVTNSHADGTRRLGNLHYPEGKESVYVNLGHELTLSDVETDGKFQKWLSEHATKANQAQNGWWEFVNAAPNTNTSEKYDKFIKTFSHPTTSFIPGQGVKAYIVNKCEASGDNFVITLKKVNVIPAGTGVILYGEANANTSNGGKTYALTAVNYSGPKFGRTGTSDEWYNFLVPTSPYGTAAADDKGVDVLPYETKDGVIWRNFGLGYFSLCSDYDSKKQYAISHDSETGAQSSKGERTNGDYVGFFRLKASHIAAGKAYLSLNGETEYTNANGGEVIVGDGEKQTHATERTIKNYQLEYKKGDQNATPLTWAQLQTQNLWQNAVWERDWGIRDFGTHNANMMITFDGEITDGIQLVIGPTTVEKDGPVYNLQGIEVTNPTKGVYIKNGKKFIVK